MSLITNPLHPGEVLAELYLDPLGMSAGSLAKALHLPRTRIERIVKGETGISPDTAHRLARYFRTTPQMWLGMQANYDAAHCRPPESELSAIEPRPLEGA